MVVGRNCRAFVMRELTGEDDLDIAFRVDARATSAIRASDEAMKVVRQKEAIRQALVEVDGKPVGGAVPYMAIDRWSQPEWTALILAFNSLNGISDEDLGKVLTAVANAEVVTDEPTPSESEIVEEEPIRVPSTSRRTAR
jgi:hypothetical protein